jgi:hypothetical protein
MYSRLFSSILNSSIWSEDSDTCKIWITLLAAQDREGYVYASPAGIARIAALPLETVKAALARFMEPDPESTDRIRAPENEGRRIVEVEGGYRLLNAAYYRSLIDAEERRQDDAERQRRKRARDARSRPVTPSHPSEAAPAPEAEAISSPAEPKRKKPTGSRGIEPTGSPRAPSGPPTAAEVRAYWTAAGLQGNPDAFFGWQTEHGWPSKLWRRAAANWAAKDAAAAPPAALVDRAGPDFEGCYTCRHAWHAGRCAEGCPTCRPPAGHAEGARIAATK